MKFIQEYVPDNRYQTGVRPVYVESNFVVYGLIKITLLLENIFKHVRITLQKKCREIEDITSTQEKDK